MDEATLQCSNLQNGTNIKETVKRIKNLCVGHPAEKTEYIQKGIVAALLKLIDPTDAELTWQICGTIGILANKNLAGAQQVVSNSGLSTLLSLLSCNQERIVKQASQCILVALQSIDDPVQVFRENMQLLETVSGLFCSSLASTSVTECTSFVLTRCLETVDFDIVVDWSRISTVCINNIKSSTLRDSTNLVPYLTVLKTLTTRLREVGIQLVDYNIVEILVELMKGVEMTVKILACKIYANLMHFNLLQEDQASKVTAVLIMPLLHRMLSKNERNVQLEGCKMLSEVASIGEIYQRQAFDCNLVHDLIELGRYISVADVEAASILLQAVAAVCSLVEDCRRLIFESRLFALVVSSLDASHSELKIAGLSALRSLSRSVRNLRTSLAEASLMEPLLKSLSDENKQVQVQALSTICNLVLYFSPLKNLFLESNGLTTLLNLCHSNDKSLKYYAIWALKNLLFLSGSKMKKRIIDEFGMDYIFCLIEKGEDYSLQEQGMNLLRNLTCTFSIESEQEIVLDFIEEHCYRLVLCIQDSLQSPSMEVVLQSLYVVCNFVVGNERHKQAICNSKVPKLLLHFLTDSNYQIRIAAIWCVINLVWKETNDICDVPNLSDCRKARIASLIEMGFEETLERLLTDSNVEVRGRAETALQLLRDRTLSESAGENEFEQISRSILL
ncbi:hypothetical protein GAYE_SCF22MG4159 [Galdieria yellowstonensis]|uniref:Armadillo repeat-containing protein 8 n=1 Tax=Galdieria yellowstonensis TaxID=3028027 RepID=A0AAV9IFK6_9RHOD|nr:hypothetical protein GAYE_SCF22MG4159 [Galdieria yellowstonensis]